MTRITPFTAVPSRQQSQEDLVTSTNTFFSEVNGFVGQANQLICDINTAATNSIFTAPDWVAQAYESHKVVIYTDHNVYISTEATLSTDVPSVSAKWQRMNASANGLGVRLYANKEIITATTTRTVPSGITVLRAYAWGKGGDGAADIAGAGGGCAYGDIAVTEGSTVTFTISSNIAKVTYNGTDVLIGNPASGATAGTASKDASVTNGGAYSGGVGRGSNSSGGASSGSPLGTGRGAAYTGGCSWAFPPITEGGAGLGSAGVSGTQCGGRGFLSTQNIIEPLFFGCDAGHTTEMEFGGSSYNADGGRGAGGAFGSSTTSNNGTGNGGFGAGGAAYGNGGFGGGGGKGGNGGLGGGGGGSSIVTQGGAAAIIIMWG